MTDELREALLARVGKPLDARGVVVAPDPVNVPMVRHWVDALDDRNPAYDDSAAAGTRFGELVAPPAMLQTWTMSRPTIDGIRERGGAPGQLDPDSPLPVLAAAGYPGTLATDTVLRFGRYLRVGDVVSSESVLTSVSERKHTGLGRGYFVTWSSRYTDAAGAEVGSQDFTVFKFRPGPPPAERPRRPATGEEPAGEALPPLDLDVTATLIVAGAIASRDFMPVHHDRDYAQGQGAPDIFMNILTSNGYVSRYVTDWAGGDAQLRQVPTRLGAPAVPDKALRFRGHVVADTPAGAVRQVEVALRAHSDLGTHVSARVLLDLPR
jgi:acyl dehydratase